MVRDLHLRSMLDDFSWRDILRDRSLMLFGRRVRMAQVLIGFRLRLPTRRLFYRRVLNAFTFLGDLQIRGHLGLGPVFLVACVLSPSLMSGTWPLDRFGWQG